MSKKLRTIWTPSTQTAALLSIVAIKPTKNMKISIYSIHRVTDSRLLRFNFYSPCSDTRLTNNNPFDFFGFFALGKKPNLSCLSRKHFPCRTRLIKKLFSKELGWIVLQRLTSAETCNRLDIFPFSYSFDIVASIVHPIWRLKFHLIFRHRHFPFDKESEVVTWLLRIKRLLRRLCDCKRNPRLPVIDFVHRLENNENSADWRQFQLMDWIYSRIFQNRLEILIRTLKADIFVSRC